MIITVTPNAAVDKTLTVPSFQMGHRHRASESFTLPGGKGINVARALRSLGRPVIATGLVGGRAGQQVIEGLQRENILSDFVHIAGESRTTTVVVDPTTRRNTEVIEYGPAVSVAEIEALIEKIEYLSKGARFLVLAGSLPRKVREDFYAIVTERVRRHRCYVVLDAAGEPLRLGVRGRPHLVCPNAREAEDLVGHEFHDEQDMIDASAMICEMGARNVIIKSRFGCVARIRAGHREHVFTATVEPLKSVVSTVGSGDAFLAGFACARYDKLDLSDCLRFGLAAAAANTQQYGAGVLDAAEAERLVATTEAVEVGDGVPAD